MASLAAITHETLTWVPREQYGMSKTTSRTARGEYAAAITADLADLDVALPSQVLADAEDASREIARFDAGLGAELAPFASVLLRSEAAASSEIENLTASARAIAEAELGNPNKRNANLIVANTRAMTAAITLADTLDEAAILAMHAALMHGQRRHTPGQWREEAVWIGGGDFGPVGASFVAPRYERVPAAIRDLLVFANRVGIPALPQVAIVHAQFETIHPFTDGNGRTGRALIQAQLRNNGLARQVTIPVSAGLLVNTDAYFDALTAYREGDAVPIVERITEASFRAITNAQQLVEELQTIRSRWADTITARRHSAIWRVTDLLLRRPVVNAVLLRDELGIGTDIARRYLDPLTEAGLIVETTDKKRNRIWRAPEVLAALDDFAARAGRRGSTQ